eukprot:210482-Prorocentrum_minimum.AAC.1
MPPLFSPPSVHPPPATSLDMLCCYKFNPPAPGKRTEDGSTLKGGRRWGERGRRVGNEGEH